MDTSSKIIGIDLGTTNSVVAVVEGEDPIVITNQEGFNKTPSVVAFLDNNDCIVGDIARRQAATNPQRTVSSVKRLMGRSFEDVEDESARFPFDLVNHEDRLLIDINGYGFSPEQISALILRKLKESAEAFLGEQVRQAVITVPAHFDDNQRNATIEAARLAGLDVLRLINEPTAAALAYGLGKGKESEEIVAVFDFGGGTFDISILEIAGKTFEVLTSTGDSSLGGDDLDNALVNLVVEEFREKHGVDLAEDPVTLRRLKEVAEKAKCELSTASQAQITLPFIAYRDGTPLHLERTIGRNEFEDLIESFVTRTIRCCKRALDDAGISKKDIDKVILVGGSTRIPMVQDAVEDFFGLQPFKGINPDEVVALGAAAQAGIFSGNIEEVTLLDVAPHSLGIEVKDGRFSRIIEKNATIPIKAAKNFTTTEDNQSFVVIHILQGEEDQAVENRSLGKFILSDIPPQPRGRARIRVTFFVNADGVMEISAEELGSGIAKTLTIVHSELDENEKSARKRARKRGKKEGGRERRSAEGEKPAKRYSAETAGGAADLRGRQATGSQPPAPARRQDGTPAPTPLPPAQPRQGFEVMGDTRPGTSPTTHVTHRASAEAVALPSREEVPLPAAQAPARPATPAPAEVVIHQPFVPQQPPGAPPARPAAPAAQATPAAPTTPDAERPSSAYAHPPRYTRPEPPRPAGLMPINEQPTTMSPPRSRVPLPDDETHDKPAPAGQPALNPFTPPPPTLIVDPPTTIVPVTETGSAIESVTWPPAVEQAIHRAQAADASGEALDLYQTALAQLQREPFATDRRFGVSLGRYWLQLALGQAEVLRAELAPVLEEYSLTNGRDLLVLLDKAVETSANPEAFRRHRSRLRELLGDLEGACEDYESAAKAEPQDGDAMRLENLYRARMARGDDPAAQFKLVRLFLKAERVDEAIEILQKLQHNEQYETRALKILGLCHWQKNLHFLAWQKFKQLRQTDEIREILYRLGADMEGTGQLANALQVYEHLMGESPDYKDVQSKVKKLRYRIKMQQEESEQGKAQSVLTDPRFTIIEEINRGSMGIIYKARDKTLDEVVALKVLNDYLCTDPSAVERFKREARAAKKLAHPYIVRIHDMFESGSKRFISMEYIEGTDLKRMLADHVHFNEDQLIFYFLQICDALAYAHKLNIIHRDIKPANVMITQANTVKVTDFGIAKILKGDDSTKSGTAVIGTPLYMAPEQITGEGVDARSDIYSLGIMMYELSSGQPPFYLGNIEYHHIHTPPPPLPATVSEKVKRIILRCVEKQAVNRYQSVDEIYEDLRKD